MTLHRLYGLALAAILMVSTARAEAPAGGSAEARIDAGVALLNTKKIEEGHKALLSVAKELQDAVGADPKNAGSQYLLSRVMFYLQEDEAAIKAGDDAIALAPKEARYHHHRGWMLSQIKREAEAIESYAEAVRLAPGNPDYCFALGYAHAGAGENAKAEKVFRAAAEKNSTEPRALGALAGFLVGKKSGEEEAISLLTKAIALDPNYANGFRNLGQIYQNQGRFEESLSAYRSLLELTPEDFAALSKMSQNFTAMGLSEEAAETRTKLYALKKAGKTDKSFFCREQFKQGDVPIMVFEYFELEGERALRYSFRVLDAAGQKTLRTISLGSYQMTTDMAREMGQIKKDERIYHLDLYEGADHATFGMYEKEPSYADVRKSVIAIMEGKVKAMSSTTGPKEMEEK